MLIPTEMTSVVLRRWDMADRTSLVAQANNRAVWRNLTDRFPHPYTSADADSWISFANRPSCGAQLCIDVAGVATDAIGIDAGEGTARRTGLFGNWLGQDYWGKGIGTAAARVMLAYAETNLPFARLEATVFEWNPASMRLLEKIGFDREGVLRRSVYKDGRLADCVMYSRILIDG